MTDCSGTSSKAAWSSLLCLCAAARGFGKFYPETKAPRKGRHSSYEGQGKDCGAKGRKC